MKHTDISRDYEHDARHFRFVRNTGLPRRPSTSRAMSQPPTG